MELLSQYELSRLTPDERLAMISQLWDSLDEDRLPLSQLQTNELDRRLASLDEATIQRDPSVAKRPEAWRLSSTPSLKQVWPATSHSTAASSGFKSVPPEIWDSVVRLQAMKAHTTQAPLMERAAKNGWRV